MSGRMFRYEAIIEQHFQVTLRSGEEFMARCIWHGDSTSSLQINAESGLFICFTCGMKGNAKTLLRELGLQYADVEVDVQDLLQRIAALSAPDTAPVLPVLNESYLKRYAIPTKYWEARGITLATQVQFGLGYDPIDDFLTIPLRDVNGGLLGVIRRYMGKDVENSQRYRYPKGFKRSQNLFASWLVEQDPDADTVVLVEGSLDAVKVWQAGYPAMAIYGSSLSASQVRVLRRLGVGKVVLMFDDDKAGIKATDSCLGHHTHTEHGRKVEEYKPETDLSREFLVYRTDYGNLGKKSPRRPSDPGAMSHDEIDHMLTKARRLF